MPDKLNLESLQDIILPSSLESGLPALGWWLVSLVIAIVFSALLLLWLRYRQLTAAKREALFALQALPSDASLVDYNQVLKRLALAYYPREQVAALHGKAWLDFLEQQVPSAQFSALEQELQSQQYQAQSQAASEQWQIASKEWLSKCAVPQLWRKLVGLPTRVSEERNV